MSGRRSRSHRRGDLTEGIGLALLRRFCVVAPIPDPEEVGLDAVATLLRPSGHVHLPERSFFVTIRSKAEFKRADRGLTYETRDWPSLGAFLLPCFLAVVDLAYPHLELYSFHRLAHRLHRERGLKREWTRLRVRLGERRGEPEAGHVAMEGKDLCLWLGPPVMSFDLSTAAEADFGGRAHAILSPFLAVDAKHMRYSDLGIVSTLRWETNSPVPRPVGWGWGGRDEIEAEREELRAILPVLYALAGRPRGSGREAETAAYRALLERCAALGLERPSS